MTDGRRPRNLSASIVASQALRGFGLRILSGTLSNVRSPPFVAWSFVMTIGLFTFIEMYDRVLDTASHILARGRLGTR